MDPIDPMQIQSFQPPVTSEIAAETKKKLKEGGTEPEEALSETFTDTFIPSEATQQLPEKKKEAFLADAKREIANLDPNSETFVDDATEKLVNSALKREYGSKLLKNVGYKQMESVIKRKLLMDPRYRPIIEEFLGKLLESEEI